MQSFFLGVIIVGIGFAIVYNSSYYIEWFGTSEWMENHLGSTRVGYILFGFLVMFVGFLLMFGLLNTGSTADVVELNLSAGT